MAEPVESLPIRAKAMSPAPHSLGLVLCACNPSIREAEARGLEAQGYPWIHSKF